MASLSVLVWLCAIGIFVGGIVRLVQKKVLQGLLLMAGSILIWIISVSMLVSAPVLEGAERKAAEAKARAGEQIPTASDLADAGRDLEVVTHEWKAIGGGSIAEWDVTLHNKSTKITYADVAYRTSYSGPSGTRVSSGRGTLYEVIRPGETKRFPAINDGFINSQADRASFVVVDAQTR